MNATVGINAYKSVSLEAQVLGADPHKLISLLIDGALYEISHAKSCIARKEIMAKGKSVSKAISIIGEGLNACLDKKVGGQLAQDLSELYEYMVMRLVEANLKNDTAILDEVAYLLGEIKGAWDAIRPQVVGSGIKPNIGNNSQRTYASA